MKSLQRVKQALLTVSDRVYHHHALKQNPPYIVWGETGGGSQQNADNYLNEQAIQGTIDLYTKKEDDPLVDGIQAALADARISFYFESADYEDETEYLHYQWIFEVS